MGKKKPTITPKYPLSALAQFPRRLSLSKHLADLEPLVGPFAAALLGKSGLAEVFEEVRAILSDSESSGKDVSEAAFYHGEYRLWQLERVFSEQNLGKRRYERLADAAKEAGMDLARQINICSTVEQMFIERKPEKLFGARITFLAPLCLTWLFTVARCFDPVWEDVPEEEQLALYRFVSTTVDPKKVLAISEIPCVSLVADCLEERCANLFLLMCAVFLEEVPPDTREYDEFWNVRFQVGMRKKFRALLREDFHTLFQWWDDWKYDFVEELLYESRRDASSEAAPTDIRKIYQLPNDIPLYNSLWMSVALCFSVWTTKRYGEFVRIRDDIPEDKTFSFLSLHKKLLTEIDDIRRQLTGLDARRQMSSVSCYFQATGQYADLTDSAKPSECVGCFARTCIEDFLLLLAKSCGQSEDCAETLTSLLLACLAKDAATTALRDFAYSMPHNDGVMPMLSFDAIRREYVRLFYVNTELDYDNAWHPVPPFQILNAVLYAIFCLLGTEKRERVDEVMDSGELPEEAHLPGGVYDFALLVSNILEGYNFAILRKERKNRRVLPAVANAKQYVGEDELATLKDELTRTKSALSDAQAAASLSAGDVLRSLQERLTASERELAALRKTSDTKDAELSRLQDALSEKSAAFDALLSSLQEPSEDTVSLSEDDLVAALSKLSFAFVGGHIQRLRELRDLGIVPRVTISATHAPKSAVVDAVVVFTDWLTHKDYYTADNYRRANNIPRVFVSGTTNTSNILRMIWNGLPDHLRNR